MAKSINLTGTTGKNYNLDELVNTNTRTNVDSELKVQIWLWSPYLPASNPHSKPNPPKPALGQIWLSKLVTDKEEVEKLKKEG